MRRRLLAIGLFVLTATGCGITKLNPTQIGNRGGWQLPERVIASLEIAPGDSVADLGAGDGYFLPYLVDAVGPTGTVYAVDVESDKASALQQRVDEAGYENVVVVLGELEDPLLPNDQIDLILLVNTYHHIEDRPAYFGPDPAQMLDIILGLASGVTTCWLTWRAYSKLPVAILAFGRATTLSHFVRDFCHVSPGSECSGIRSSHGADNVPR